MFGAGMLAMRYLAFICTFICSMFIAVGGVHAAVISYTFGTSEVIEQRGGTIVNADQKLFLPVDTITASFDYDNAAAPWAFQPITFATLYQNIEGLTASVGESFSTGSIYHSSTTVVSDDGFTPAGSLEQYDALWVDAYPNAVAPPVSGSPQLFDGTAEQFVLQDIRVFWLENQIGTDFFDDESLPSALPDLDFGTGGVALIFKPFNSESTTGDHIVVAPITVISAVPLPAAVWLFGSGLGLLGWFRRR
jgi:hypothetical protein